MIRRPLYPAKGQMGDATQLVGMVFPPVEKALVGITPRYSGNKHEVQVK